jgi:MFS superfamily sulfate permease-like transporter
VRTRVMTLVAERASTPHLVILFMGNVPYVDLAGAEFLSELHSTLAARGIELKLAEAHTPVREAMQSLGEPQAMRLAERNQTVDQILTSWRTAAALA